MTKWEKKGICTKKKASKCPRTIFFSNFAANAVVFLSWQTNIPENLETINHSLYEKIYTFGYHVDAMLYTGNGPTHD